MDTPIINIKVMKIVLRPIVGKKSSLCNSAALFREVVFKYDKKIGEMILVLSYDDSEQDPVTAYMIRQNISFVSPSLRELTEGRLRVMVDFNDDSLYIDGINLNEKVNVIWWDPLKYTMGCNGTAASCLFFV